MRALLSGALTSRILWISSFGASGIAVSREENCARTGDFCCESSYVWVSHGCKRVLQGTQRTFPGAWEKDSAANAAVALWL